MVEAGSLVHWIALALTVIGFVVTGAATYGALMTRQKIADKTIETLNRQVERLSESLTKGRESQGRRIGVLEERIAHVEGRSGFPRRRSDFQKED